MLKTLEFSKHSQPNTLIVWLHGLGASGADLLPVARHLSTTDELRVKHLLPDAPSMAVSLNNHAIMPAWYNLYGLEVNAPEDSSGIKNSCTQIEELVLQTKRQDTSIDKVFIAGFSQGGALALHMGLHGHLLYDGIIGLSTYLPLHDRLSKCDSQRIRELDVLMIHGTHDQVIPLHYASMSRDVLASAGARITWHEYPSDHSIHPNAMVDLRNWLVKKIGQND